MSVEKSSEGTSRRTERLWPFVIVGAFFGFVLVKSEVVSWFRIQEMFRFDSFHMYGVIGSAIAVGVAARWALGQAPVRERPRPNHLLGGVVFGLGWGLTGACPGPIYALIGYGITPYAAVWLGALAGTWLYGVVLGAGAATMPRPATPAKGSA